MDASETPPAAAADVHQKIGLLTRQLHDALNELGYADQLRGSAGELPDAQNRLSYIARLTGEAAEKVLSRVEQAKAQQDRMAAENRRVLEAWCAIRLLLLPKVWCTTIWWTWSVRRRWPITT
jgi:chemotaxis protein CheZ